MGDETYYGSDHDSDWYADDKPSHSRDAIWPLKALVLPLALLVVLLVCNVIFLWPEPPPESQGDTTWTLIPKLTANETWTGYIYYTDDGANWWTNNETNIYEWDENYLILPKVHEDWPGNWTSRRSIRIEW